MRARSRAFPRPLAGDFLRAPASNGTTPALVVGSHRAADFVVLRRPEGGTPASAPARMESAEAALGASFAPAREDSVAPVRVAGDEV